jgi:hypothetical protein
MVAVRPDPAEIERVLQTAQRLGADHASCAALLVLAQRRPGDHSALLGALLAAGGDHARRAIAELLQQSGLHRR